MASMRAAHAESLFASVALSVTLGSIGGAWLVLGQDAEVEAHG